MSLNVPLIIGIVLAAVLLVGIIVAAILMNRSDKKKNKPEYSDANADYPAAEETPLWAVADAPEYGESNSKQEPAPVAEPASEQEPAPEQESAPAEEAAPEQEPAPAAEPAAEEKSSRTADDQTARKRVKPAAGAWTVECKREGEYVAVLCAKNGELMLSSETYTTVEGARSGIATIVRNITGSGKFLIYRDKSDNYYYKLKTAGNKLLCVGEIYRSKDQCEKAVESVKRLAAEAPVSDDVVTGDEYLEYVPMPVQTGKSGAPGKWQIEKTAEGRFRAKLFAGNGQLMLATEEVSSARAAGGSLEAVVKNAAEGNFVIDRDKFGRYYYKLRNAQKSMICIGETYDSLLSCVKAIETVRRYCATATLA